MTSNEQQANGWTAGTNGYAITQVRIFDRESSKRSRTIDCGSHCTAGKSSFTQQYVQADPNCTDKISPDRFSPSNSALNSVFN